MAAPTLVRESPALPAALEARILANKQKWTQKEANAYLDACSKIMMIIPPDPWEAGMRGRRLKYVCWNGWPFLVEKNKPVMVPQPIAEILAASMEIDRTDQMKEREPYRMIVSSEAPNGMDTTLGMGYRPVTGQGE